MKRNVDLSQNRIFTTPEEPTGEAKILLDWFKKLTQKPWDFENKPMEISSDLDLKASSKYEELIITGNKHERQIRKQNRLYDAGKVCDICGFDTRKRPWLGKTCNCYSMIYKPKMPWTF